MTRNSDGVLRFGPTEWLAAAAIGTAQVGAGLGAYVMIDRRVTALEARQMTDAEAGEIAKGLRNIDVLIEQVRQLQLTVERGGR
jgi:hypothetical protein